MSSKHARAADDFAGRSPVSLEIRAGFQPTGLRGLRLHRVVPRHASGPARREEVNPREKPIDRKGRAATPGYALLRTILFLGYWTFDVLYYRIYQAPLCVDISKRVSHVIKAGVIPPELPTISMVGLRHKRAVSIIGIRIESI